MKYLGIYNEIDSAKFAFNNQLWFFVTILFDEQNIITCFEIKDLNFSAVL